MIPCFVLCIVCIVEAAILVVLSAGEQNMQGTCCSCKRFNAVHPVISFVCDPAVAFRGFAYEAAEIA